MNGARKVDFTCLISCFVVVVVVFVVVVDVVVVDVVVVIDHSKTLPRK